MKLTYKEIITSISGVSCSHMQVNEFAYGNLYKKMKEINFNYPLVFLTDGKSEIIGSDIQLNFILLVMDRVIHSDVNEIDVLSNTLQIGLDILGELQYSGGDNFYLDYSRIPISNYVDNFQEDVGGWRFDMTIRTPENWNSCIAPFRT